MVNLSPDPGYTPKYKPGSEISRFWKNKMTGADVEVCRQFFNVSESQYLVIFRDSLLCIGNETLTMERKKFMAEHTPVKVKKI